jgi:hypothetical protein
VPRASSSLPLLALLAACAANPTDPDALEVVPRTAPAEAPEPRQLRARLASRVAGDLPLELWLPLPAAGPDQVVESLVVEVPPPGVYELLEVAPGERVLHVTGPPPGLTAGWRAVVAQPACPPAPLPAPLRALARDLSAQAWVEAARRAGAETRLAHGLLRRALADRPDLAAEGEWPELRHGDAWRAVDPVAGALLCAPPGLRLGGARSRAAAGEAEVAPGVQAELE